MRKKSAANQGGESKRSRVYQYGLRSEAGPT